MNKSLKYEFSADEANFIIGALNKVQVSGVQTAQALVAVVQKLQNPVNADEIDKQVYEDLKNRFEPKTKEEKK